MNSIPSGVVQFFEPVSSLRRKVENRLIEFFDAKGYKEIVTSIFSYEDSIFEGLYEPLKTQLFKIIDKNSGQTMILRADITMQITQAVIMGNFDMPVKVCYADNIYRDIKEHSGQKREFRQTGVELFGIKDISADREIIELAVSSLKELNLSNLYLRISDTYILHNLMERFNINKREKIDAIEEAVHKKNFDLVLKRVDNLPEGFVEQLELLNKKSGYFTKLEDYEDVDEYAFNAVKLADELRDKYKDVSIFLDLFYCEYPMYHHGVVFDIFSDHTNLAVGGRYGNVTRQFGKYIPATGFAINLDELTYFLFDKEKK